MIVLFMGGKTDGNVSSVVWGPPGFRGLNVSEKSESLVLDARAGFIPNGKNDRSHHGATLLALRIAGAGAAELMLDIPGHSIDAMADAAYRSSHAKREFFCDGEDRAPLCWRLTRNAAE
ncbi:MAG: hypothetical protein EXS37_16600 [Opitutus sp.]|nr:hypothetical protein [Opitutus sp.]